MSGPHVQLLAYWGVVRSLGFVLSFSQYGHKRLVLCYQVDCEFGSTYTREFLPSLQLHRYPTEALHPTTEELCWLGPDLFGQSCNLSNHIGHSLGSKLHFQTPKVLRQETNMGRTVHHVRLLLDVRALIHNACKTPNLPCDGKSPGKRGEVMDQNLVI